MRDYKQIEKTEIDYKLSSITCNKCGTTHTFKSENQFTEWQEETFQSFDFTFGYGSKFDEEHWKFDLCEDCLEELVDSFVHKPEGYRK
ncbi:hypothetical protein [Ureibacillus aquaedulcis]|uniref:Uncharacterized protein n=1 Tax=Ureibacillus aquaedulcis TaxID=3058421 RepID=A0ABT8GPL1_9BACL|nr:hypothetical protein [Ureibacillus sp. BA0131]MDN4493357.1 hypothetical protein [Ureibacillus sp. BA0131]